MKYGMSQMLSEFNRRNDLSERKVNSESWSKRFKTLAGNLKKEVAKVAPSEYDFFFKDILADLRKKQNQENLYYHLTRLIEHTDFQMLCPSDFEPFIRYLEKEFFHANEIQEVPANDWYLVEFTLKWLVLGREKSGWKGAVFYLQKDFIR